MEPKELVVYDDKVEYTAQEIHNLVNMILAGNRNSTSNKGSPKIISAFGIAGKFPNVHKAFNFDISQCFLFQVS